ncbi:MAG: HflC protein [Candidatus Fischerbacteria bacterium RBG_13_37_8]|uniref:Protein HflC n=1 Tax=Candidatus Fischerbacteria bacterium RBG_13_37_8 TaxID=1817863 RepID=A0A1F5V6F4_9BACT|nr:MAG: HflC protein [Candidatus Fischerbacteria bacterium RBG_13_37_8]
MPGKKVIFYIFLLVVLIFIGNSIYTINETEQVVITQFGDPIDNAIKKDAGLYLKAPFIWEIHRFEKRFQKWDGYPNQIPTKDKKYIWVDTTARWRIMDPLKFLKSVGNEQNALGRLDDIIDSTTRDLVSRNLLIDVVRSTNRLTTLESSEEDVHQEEFRETITFGQKAILEQILASAKKLALQYGIELLDVRIKRINYIEQVLVKVYERMISERKRIAEQYRSEGQGKKAEISGLKEKDLRKIRSVAYKTAQEIIGKADAEATRVYAEAYNKDPEFYAFVKSLETYSQTVKSNNVLIMSTESDYYKYLKNIKAR